MSSIDNNCLRFLRGLPAIFKDICLVYSPTLGEIAATGLDKFYQYLSLIMIEKPKTEEAGIAELLKKLSDFEYMVLISQIDSSQYQLIKSAFNFFTHEDVTLLMDPPSILFGDPNEKRMITKDQFIEFQQLVKQACAAIDSNEQSIEFLDSDSEDTRRIKMQILQGRKDRAKAKANQAKTKDESDVKLSDLIASLCVGTNGAINMLNVWDLTYYAFQDQVKRMSWREEFDINTRAAMAGAKIKKDKLSHWIKSMTFK